MRPAVLALALTAALSARAQYMNQSSELNPARAAQIEHEQQKLYDEIDKKHGNKAPNEMDSAERKQIAQERSEAEEKVFEKQGVDRKEYTRYVNRLGRDDLSAFNDAKEALSKKDAAATKKGDDDAPRDPKDIPIQRGFNDQNPVTLEEKKGGQVTVEHGLPPEAESDQAAAAASGLTDSSSEKRPEKKEPKKKGR